MSLTSALERVAELSAPAPAAQPAATTATPQTQTSFASALASASSVASASPSTSSPYDATIDAAGARHGVDPDLIRAVIAQESGGDASATSAAGAQGLMQLMPDTARGLGIANPYDPAQAIDGGTRYLKQELDRFGGDPRLALAAYNAGPGAVERFGGVPPYAETQNYVQQVLGRYEQLHNERSGT